MSGKHYPKEFQVEAIKQIVDRCHFVSSIGVRLSITTHSLYAWLKKYGSDSSYNKQQADALDEIRQLQQELTQVIDELNNILR